MDWIMSIAAVAILAVVLRGFWKADKTNLSDKEVNPAKMDFKAEGLMFNALNVKMIWKSSHQHFTLPLRKSFRG